MVATVATGGGALLSFGFGSGGERRRFLRLEPQVAKVGELPLFPLLIKRERADVSPFRINKTTHDLSHDAAFNACRWGRARWIRSKIRRYPGRACPCPVLGLAQQRSVPCVAQARGLLSVY